MVPKTESVDGDMHIGTVPVRMARAVKLSRIDGALETLSYPIDRKTAADELSDVTVLFADGESNLGSIVEQAGSERFENPTDLRDELFEYLPTEALGEPGQSEGDA